MSNGIEELLDLTADALHQSTIDLAAAVLLNGCAGDFVKLQSMRLQLFKKHACELPSFETTPDVFVVIDLLRRGDYVHAIDAAADLRARWPRYWHN